MIIFTWGIKIGINIYITHAVSTPGAIVKKKKKQDVKVADRITATMSTHDMAKSTITVRFSHDSFPSADLRCGRGRDLLLQMHPCRSRYKFWGQQAADMRNIHMTDHVL